MSAISKNVKRARRRRTVFNKKQGEKNLTVKCRHGTFVLSQDFPWGCGICIDERLKKRTALDSN